MKYSLILDRPKATLPTYIFILIPFPEGRLKYSIKEQIVPSDWDPDFMLPSKNNEDYKALSRKITRIKDKLDDLSREEKRKGILFSKSEIEKELDRLIGKTTSHSHDDFFSCVDIIYKEMESGSLLTPKGNRYEAQTLTNFRQSIRVLNEFNPRLKFSAIDMETYHSFIHHMNKQNLSINTCGTHIKCFKRLIAIGFEKGWHVNNIFTNRKFKTLSEATEDISLSEEEIKILWNKKLPNAELEICRDWFVLDCYSGLRISDIQRLNKRNLSGDFILISNEKTDAKVEIPIHPIVKQIIRKYKGLPPKVSDQEINRKIKQVAELCKINETVLYVITKGGKRKDEYYKKFEMISNHTARRSFITNLRKNGVPDSIVMKLTGIVKPQTMQKYDKLSAKEAAHIAAQHSFFKKK